MKTVETDIQKCVSLVYIILVNYNGWKDTVECIESVFKSSYRQYRIIMVDNDSTNDSMKYIRRWTSGKLSSKARNSSVEYCEYDYDGNFKRVSGLGTEKLVCINSGNNNGFASGNNIGIKFAQKQQDSKFIWLLNNDTVITKKTILTLQNSYKKDTLLGACIKNYYNRDEILTFGGGILHPVYGNGFHLSSKKLYRKYFQRLDFITGASMFFDIEIVKKFGLMDEDFFLYYEDIDFCQRLKKVGIGLDVSINATVYHKECNSTGKSSPLSDYYSSRNNLIVLNKYKLKNWVFPRLFGIYIYYALKLLKRLLQGKFESANGIYKGILDGLRICVKNKYIGLRK